MSFVLQNVAKSLVGKRILNDVSFSTPNSGMFIVMGHSGSGKSTILRLLNRLDEPDGGTILYNGTDITEINPRELRREVSYVFQTPAPLPGTVAENIRFGTDILDRDVDIPDLLKRVGLSPDYKDKPADELSVGEAQRMMIARALALNPRVLLLDEPTSALDPANALSIERTINKLIEDEGLLAVFVTHSPEQVERLGGEGLLLVSGEVRGLGKAQNLVKHLQGVENDD